MSGPSRGSAALTQVRNRLSERGAVWQGCTPDEIERLKAAAGVPTLPKLYVEFLLEFGGEMKPRMIEGSFSAEYLASLYPLEPGDYLDSLPPGSVVIVEYDGYQAHYLPWVDEDDPPVWKIQEGGHGEPHSASLSEWIVSRLR